MAAQIAITDPELIERQNVPDEEYLGYFLQLIGNFPEREWTRAAFERGLRYPWYRPNRSYLLRDGQTTLLHELDETEVANVLERHAGPASGRVPLVAIGANAAPKNLALKLAHHAERDDRDVLALAGELHELDIVACAAVAVYGAMPATPAASPGTSVPAALLFVNATQLTTLTWGEITYRLGRLRGAPFTVEDGIEGLELESPLAYVSRWGAFAPDGVPAPLAALPGRDRRTDAWTQLELLERVADIALDGDGGAEGLTRAICADAAAMGARVVPSLRPYAQPFDFPDWVPIAADGTLPDA